MNSPLERLVPKWLTGALVAVGIFLLSSLAVLADGPVGTIIDDDVFVTTSWTKAKSPYIVTKRTVRVYSDAILTIEPGVQVLFDAGSALIVEDATLMARGTPAEPITFTGNMTEPVRGFWRGIYLDYASNARLEHAHITYAGLGGPEFGEAHPQFSSLSVRAAGAVIDHCTISHSLGNGIELISDEERTTISHCTFVNNGSQDDHYDIKGGLRIYPAAIVGCDFATERTFPVALPPGAVGVLDNNAFRPHQKIKILSSGMDVNALWRDYGINYVVSETRLDQELPGIVVAGPITPVLTIEPGVTIEFDQGVGLFIGTATQPGALVAEGTPAQPITMTTSDDMGGGRWAGLAFDARADPDITVLRGLNIGYGGRGYQWHETFCDGNINIYKADITVEGCEIHHSNQHGISMYESNATIINSTFYQNGQYPSQFDIFAEIGSLPTIMGNHFGPGPAYAVHASAQAVGRVRNNTFDGTRGISVSGSFVRANTSWQNQGASHYLVEADMLVAGPADPTLTLEAGLVLKFAEIAGIQVGVDGQPGGLVIDGGASPVRLTQAKEGRYWRGIFISETANDANCRLNGAVVEYGGSEWGPLWYGRRWSGAINIYGSSPTIQNGQIAYANKHGIEMQTAAPAITGNIFYKNGTAISHYDISADELSTPSISGNILGAGTGQQTYAVKVQAGSVGRLQDNIFYPSKGVYVLQGTVSADATWTNQGMSHCFVRGSITVAGAATPLLTLGKGVTLKFDRTAGLYVGTEALPGALVADGGSPNGDPKPIHLTRGDDGLRWQGIFFDATCDSAQTVLAHVIVDYGGSNAIWRGKYWNGNINIYHASPTIRQSVIGHGERHGIRMENSDATIMGNAFLHNGGQNLNYDILADAVSAPTIAHNTFQAGPTWAAKIPAAILPKLHMNVVEPGRGIHVMAGDITQDCAIQSQGSYYYFDGPVNVYGPSNPTLTIGPNNTLKFDVNAGLFIGTDTQPGALIADGLSGPITLTRQLNISTGAWQGLFFDALADSERSVLRHVTVEHAGKTFTRNGTSWSANVNIDRSSPTLLGCTIAESYRHGIQVVNSQAMIQDCDFRGNGSGDTHYDLHSDQTSQLYVVGSAFESARIYAARVSLATLANMQDNITAPGRVIHVVTGDAFLESDAVIRHVPGLDYYRVEGDLIVAGPTVPLLTIEPNVTLKFDRPNGFFVGHESFGGALVADGSAGPIIMTQAREGTFYRWGGLFFGPTADTARSVLRHVTLSYGGNARAWHGSNWYGTLNLYRKSLQVESCTLSQSLRHGAQLLDSNATFQDCAFSENVQYGLYITGGAPMVTGGTFAGNGSTNNYGDIYATLGSAAMIQGATLDSASKYGLYCDAASPTVTGSTIANHGYGIYIRGVSSHPIITQNTIRDNTVGVHNSLTGGSPIIGGSPGQGNTFVNNSSYAVENLARRRCLDARYNDWGHASGPKDEDTPIADGCVEAHHAGQGNAVSPHVY